MRVETFGIFQDTGIQERLNFIDDCTEFKQYSFILSWFHAAPNFIFRAENLDVNFIFRAENLNVKFIFRAENLDVNYIFRAENL